MQYVRTTNIFFELKTAVTDGALFRQVKLIRSGHAYMIIRLHQLSSTCDHSKPN